MIGCLSSANDANVSIPFGVRYHQETVLLGDTDGNLAIFVSRMFFVKKRDQLRIGKNSPGLLKANAMFLPVGFRLIWIPFKW